MEKRKGRSSRKKGKKQQSAEDDDFRHDSMEGTHVQPGCLQHTKYHTTCYLKTVTTMSLSFQISISVSDYSLQSTTNSINRVQQHGTF